MFPFLVNRLRHAYTSCFTLRFNESYPCDWALGCIMHLPQHAMTHLQEGGGPGGFTLEHKTYLVANCSAENRGFRCRRDSIPSRHPAATQYSHIGISACMELLLSIINRSPRRVSCDDIFRQAPTHSAAICKVCGSKSHNNKYGNQAYSLDLANPTSPPESSEL